MGTSKVTYFLIFVHCMDHKLCDLNVYFVFRFLNYKDCCQIITQVKSHRKLGAWSVTNCAIIQFHNYFFCCSLVQLQEGYYVLSPRK